MINPDYYSIIVRKEEHEGQEFWVGRVWEFPNIATFESTWDYARSLVDAIETLKCIADAEGHSFPEPYNFDGIQYESQKCTNRNASNCI